jgi:hypothetical protein
MSEEIQDIKNLYSVTFTVGIFLLLVFEFFLKSNFHVLNNLGLKSSEILLNWSVMIGLYILSFFFLFWKEKKIFFFPIVLKNIKGILLYNLMFISLILFLSGVINNLETNSKIFSSTISFIYFVLLIVVAWIIPIILIITNKFPKFARMIFVFFSNIKLPKLKSDLKEKFLFSLIISLLVSIILMISESLKENLLLRFVILFTVLIFCVLYYNFSMKK